MGRKAEKQNEQRRLDGIEKTIGETNESMAKLKGKLSRWSRPWLECEQRWPPFLPESMKVLSEHDKDGRLSHDAWLRILMAYDAVL